MARQVSLLRIRGVGGLHVLAAEVNENARNALLNKVVETKIRTVKNDAIWGYLSTSNDIEAEKEYLNIGVLFCIGFVRNITILI